MQGPHQRETPLFIARIGIDFYRSSVATEFIALIIGICTALFIAMMDVLTVSVAPAQRCREFNSFFHLKKCRTRLKKFSLQKDMKAVLIEILLRVIFLGVVCLCQLKVQPHTRHITEAELLDDYKRPRQDSFVPAWATVLLIVFVPLCCICIPFTWTKNYVDTVQALLAWTLALTINAVMTESVKLIVGRPRPDFFWRCFPDGQMTPGLRCTGDPYDVMEGRKSFPSGHSSFSFCSLGFLSFWFCGKLGVLSRNRGQSCDVIVCLVPLMAASLVAVSRVCDNHHHWEDVVVGSLLGFTTSYFCYHQYYHPLDSGSSGEPYAMIIDHQFFDSDYDSDFFDMYQSQCSTRDLKDVCLMLHLCKKNISENNKKIS